MPDNAQIARSVLEELYGQGKLDLVDKYYDPGFEGHETLMETFGRDQLKKNVQMYRAGFPDLSITADEVVAAGDKVLVRWKARGTHQGTFLSMAPTGRQTEVDGLSVITFRNGKVVEAWAQWDALGLLQELGMAPQIQTASP